MADTINLAGYRLRCTGCQIWMSQEFDNLGKLSHLDGGDLPAWIVEALPYMVAVKNREILGLATQWCNIQNQPFAANYHNWKENGAVYHFADGNHAMLFKLTWAG